MLEDLQYGDLIRALQMLYARMSKNSLFLRQLHPVQVELPEPKRVAEGSWQTSIDLPPLFSFLAVLCRRKNAVHAAEVNDTHHSIKAVAAWLICCGILP